MMQTRTTLTLFLSFLLFLKGFAEGNNTPNNSLIYGQIAYKGQAIPMAAVYVKGTSTGTTSDAEGKFWLYLKPGKYTIVFQALGYETQVLEVVLNERDSRDLRVELEELSLMIDPVTISGTRIGLLRYLPGSVSVLDNQKLLALRAVSNTDAFRHVPGVHAVDEDPAGLRTNLAIRGLDPDRSRSQLVLEDGVPVALGPYGEPELYYSPSIDRMSGVEILKGNGQILYGPQTIGGVINYLTADPPSEASGFLSLKGAEGGFFSGRLHFGNTLGNTGYTFDYLRKQADKLGALNFRLNDLNGKIRIKSGLRSVVNIKWSIYDETSNATYVGLTQPMFDEGENDFAILAPNDRLDIRRYALSLQHTMQLSDKLSLRQLAYAYTTKRNWRRQDFAHSASASGLTGVVWGDPSMPEGAIFMRNSTGNRNRAFEVAGFENRITYNYSLANASNQIDAGIRIHTEKALEQRINGKLAEARSGDLREDEMRRGLAGSLFMQQKTRIGEKFAATYGLRAEALNYHREILRVAGKDTLISGLTKNFALIPGAGINYNFNNNAGLFAGIHKGYAPPRIKDAISNSGEDVNLDAEISRNAEIGVRLTHNDLMFTMTAYHMKFDNQVIPVSESSGGQGAGLINGGESVHKGIEANIVYKSNKINDFDLETGISASIMQSRFSTDRFVIYKIRKTAPYDTTLLNINGNSTPYSPSVIASFWAEMAHKSGISAGLSWQFTGRQYTDLMNTESAAEMIAEAAANPDFGYPSAVANGRIGAIPSYQTLNLRVCYIVPKTGIGFSVQVRNLLDERYIVTRRPQGIRIGMPRMIIAGIDWNF